jgi:hypothetical protein
MNEFTYIANEKKNALKWTVNDLEKSEKCIAKRVHCAINITTDACVSIISNLPSGSTTASMA